MGRSKGFLLGALAIAALLSPTAAQATAPTLDTVAESSTSAGVLTASWTLPTGMAPDYVEVATSPRVSDVTGDFVLSVFIDGPTTLTTWTATQPVPAGTYFVHIAAIDEAQCNLGNCADESSNVVSVEVGGGIPATPAHPPTLDPVTQSSGQITANWTLDPSERTDFIEIATKPDKYPGGGFLVENTVAGVFEFLGFDINTYTSAQLQGGTYYVHVAGFDDSQCPTGVEITCFIDDYSTTETVTIPPSPSGGGGGAGGGGSSGASVGTQQKTAPVAADTLTAFSALKAAKSQRIDKLFVLAGMGEAGTITAGGTVNVPSLSKVYKFKTASANVAAGGTVKLKLKLPTKALKAVKKALKRHKKIKANLTITARDKAGNKKSEKQAVLLRL